MQVVCAHHVAGLDCFIRSMIRPRECPICHKPVLPSAEGVADFFPFCSERCRQVDLLRWSKGQYAIVEPLTPEKLLENDENQNPNDE